MNQSILERLQEAVKQDKTWTPSIVMNLDQAGNPQDIVPFLQPNEIERSSFMAKGYPKNSSFCFYPFEGMEMKSNLIDELRKAGLKGGSLLNFRSRGKMSKLRIHTIEVTCAKHLLSRTTKTETMYNDNCIQQCGTIIQPKHQSSSVKGSSRSSKLKHVKYDKSTCTVAATGSKNRMTSIRPVEAENKCPFMFYVFLSTHDNKWYLSYSSTSSTRMCHQNHFKIPDDSIIHNYGDLPTNIKSYIRDSIGNYVPGPNIVNMVSTLFGVNLTSTAIGTARKEYTTQILNDYSVDPANSSCDKLLEYFRGNEEISFLSVTHSVDSGFVTYRRTRCSKKSILITQVDKNVGIFMQVLVLPVMMLCGLVRQQLIKERVELEEQGRAIATESIQAVSTLGISILLHYLKF